MDQLTNDLRRIGQGIDLEHEYPVIIGGKGAIPRVVDIARCLDLMAGDGLGYEESLVVAMKERWATETILGREEPPKSAYEKELRYLLGE